MKTPWVEGTRRPTTGEQVSHPASRSTAPADGPSLLDVHRDPTILNGLPLPVIVHLRRQVSHLAADLEAAFLIAMATTGTQDRRSEPDRDRLLTPEAAAERFGVTKRWLLDHADDMPGVKRLSRKIVRFSERRLARFLDRGAV